ncbi:MAG: sulfide/dihydroorotate dehydrogenase-like FAD/NAD-binding protein [Candidatus Omnitrophica bacterium]|nr:sulfide/dihydroorotate dehydrogenase-like FAD/NAD-binding protein [Candidatus Omnitrophota bacterium]
MNLILSKNVLTNISGTSVAGMSIEAPEIARSARPGQFVAIMVSEVGERIPLTIVENHPKNGTVSIIFQEAGLTTKLLGKMNAGEEIYSIVGPLGHPTDIKKYGKIIMVGGGVGIAEILPVAAALKAAGNHVTTILGARTKNILILEKELKALSDEFYVATDDGSYGRKGFTIDVLDELLKKSKYDLVYSVGPIPMMRRTAAVTKPYGVKTLVSLNALMVDATGMCGCCRVTVAGEVKFSCVDGPEFDANSVDWDELTKRNNIYSEKEKHICSLSKL